MSVVLIACPCALGLATPLAVWTALGNAARRQVLFRSGETVERMAGVRVACFDKTGTLTTGRLKVRRLIPAANEDATDHLALVRELAPHSSHPVARAVSAYLADNNASTIPTPRVESVRERPGLGLLGQTGTGTVCLGNQRLLREQGVAIDRSLQRQLEAEASAGNAVSWLARDGRAVAGFVLEEQLRSEARDVIAQLRQAGLQLLMLSGDQQTRVASLAAELKMEYRAELLPDDKLETIRRLQHEVGPVMMVGDGINDAPALAASDVGVAMGCGTDLSRDAAGVCLLTSELQRLVWATQLARRTTRVVRQNLVWAFAYNSAGIAVAACGLLNPIVAAVVMIVSSGLVIGNSLRLADATGSEASPEDVSSPHSPMADLTDASTGRPSPVLMEAVR